MCDHKMCDHRHLVPIEYQAGRRCYSGKSSYVDMTSNIINAHILRVTKFYCPSCGHIVTIDVSEEDE